MSIHDPNYRNQGSRTREELEAICDPARSRALIVKVAIVEFIWLGTFVALFITQKIELFVFLPAMLLGSMVYAGTILISGIKRRKAQEELDRMDRESKD